MIDSADRFIHRLAFQILSEIHKPAGKYS